MEDGPKKMKIDHNKNERGPKKDEKGPQKDERVQKEWKEPNNDENGLQKDESKRQNGWKGALYFEI